MCTSGFANRNISAASSNEASASMLIVLLPKRFARRMPFLSRASTYIGTSVEVMQEFRSSTGM
ncbi:MAG: hypothetical protein BWY81_00899 [Firmicutes bacterium ADurb.Bin467]|nr:MAG: hypothetical protein BWY81_00899 [Firmicutes bacterium ADurb.Bin467]